MNQALQHLPELLGADALSIESALAAGGWKPQGRTSWRLATARGDALLEEVAQRDRWRQYYLSGGATPPSTSGRVLYDNFSLWGPAKLIARPGDSPICRLDVPEDLTGSIRDSIEDSFALGADFHVLDARTAWVQAVTALATGNIPREESAPASDADIAAELKQAGWSASVDDGRVIIHLQLPGVYRQLVVEHDQPAGVKLVADLIELADLEDPCLGAMLLLAQEANARLPLVRIAVLETTQCVTLRAEVSFGVALTVGSLWLHALQAFENTVALTARELDALRDAELAGLVLAAAAVRNSVGPI